MSYDKQTLLRELGSNSFISIAIFSDCFVKFTKNAKETSGGT